MPSDKHICKNCLHYRRHYIKNAKGYSPIFWGHCVFKTSIKLYYCDTIACEHWESDEAINVLRTEHIDKVLRTMAEKLEEIAFLLKDNPD